MATILVGHVGHRNSANYLAVDLTFAGNECGCTLMQTAEAFFAVALMSENNLCVHRDNEAVKTFHDYIGYQEENVY